jgi:hypothetical protein
MKNQLRLLFVAFTFSLAIASSAMADDHTYQVTGPIVAVTDTTITVMKGADKWTVSRDANTKVTGDLKVGTKVTIKYHMTADTVVTK